jgi:4-amino-4-deoxy-L-arabinose transferase-like glycosyltransferase
MRTASASLYGALIAGVLLRVAWAALVPVIPISDSGAYDILARNLAAGDGFVFTKGEPTCYFLPGAPFIYAALYFVFGQSYWTAVVLHVLVGAASVALVWKLTNEWFGSRAASISAWTLALWPSQIMFVTILATELLFGFLLLASLWLWTRETLSIWARGLLLGPLLALTALVRPHALLLPAIFALERLVRTRQSGASLGAAALAAIAMLAVLSPWAWRNHHHFGAPVLVAANFGATLWMGNNPQSSGGFMHFPPDVRHLNDVEREKELRRRATEFIKANPVRFAELSALRLLKTHGYETIHVGWNSEGIKQVFGEGALMPLKLISTGYWYAVLLAALVGVYLLLRQEGIRRGVLHPSVMLWGYFAAVHAVVLFQDRYHFVSIPMIAALAGFAAALLLERRPAAKPVLTAAR